MTASSIPLLSNRKSWAAIAKLSDVAARNFIVQSDDSDLLQAFSVKYPECFAGTGERIPFSRLMQDAKDLGKEMFGEEEKFLALDVACERLGIPTLFSWNEDEGGRTAATIYSITVTCKRLGTDGRLQAGGKRIDPFRYLRDVLAAVSSHPAKELDELLPDRWAARQTKIS
jgi:hypothetical protein